MVGFEHLSQECPSVSFFFARLGVFLEHSFGRCPQLGSFVSRSSAIRPVLFTLYPLICQSLVRYYLEMDPVEYRLDDVRSSELETGLSSNAESLNQVVDTTISKLPSTSTLRPLHALSESCSLEESHLKGYRKRFQFPKGTSVRLPCLGERLVISPTRKCVFMWPTSCAVSVFLFIPSSCKCWMSFKSL